MAGNMRFIRKNGRVIPIAGNTQQEFNKDLKRNAIAKASSIGLAVAAGVAGTMGHKKSAISFLSASIGTEVMRDVYAIKVSRDRKQQALKEGDKEHASFLNNYVKHLAVSGAVSVVGSGLANKFAPNIVNGAVRSERAVGSFLLSTVKPATMKFASLKATHGSAFGAIKAYFKNKKAIDTAGRAFKVAGYLK